MSTSLLGYTLAAVPPSLNVRQPGDSEVSWRIFRRVVGTGDPGAMGPLTTKAKALAYWMARQGAWFVAQLDGPVVGGRMTHPSQPSFGSHVASAPFVLDSTLRGYYERLGLRILGRVPEAFWHRGERHVDASVSHRFLDEEAEHRP